MPSEISSENMVCQLICILLEKKMTVAVVLVVFLKSNQFAMTPHITEFAANENNCSLKCTKKTAKSLDICFSFT